MTSARLPRPRVLRAAVFGWVAFAACAAAADYALDIKPLLKERCYACHGALKQKGGLRLDTVAAMKAGGDSGGILDAEHALLLERVTAADKDERMPPEGEGSALNAEEVAKLRAWIAAGAPAVANETPEPDPREHWAYQPPQASGKSLDALLAERLAANNLKPQPAAAPEIWLRRVYLDLIGLPPTPEQVRAYLALPDRSDAAKAKIVDALLASPQYGERWARHFMDIWRYSDWYGLGAQLRYSQKHLWHWRDWIIESLNSDKGYDEMIRQMLAADELAPEDRDNLRATGYLARSYYLFNRTTWLDATIEHTCRAFLGLTMQCVKCHDHKYDPVEQADYYRMRAIFEPLHVRLDPVPGQVDFEKDGLPRVFDLHLDRPTFRHVRGDEKNEDKSRALPPGIPRVLEFAAFQPQAVALPPAAVTPALLSFVLRDQLAAADREWDAAQKANNAAAMRAASLRTAMIQATYAADVAGADPHLASAAALAEARYLAAKAEVDLAKAEAAAPSEDRDKKLAAARTALDQARARLDTPGETYTPLAASLKAQDGPVEKDNAAVQRYPETSTGRRLALAQWITDRRNPLTARVLVNHVWLRHFGAPLVANVDDFGRRSPAPLHQDILDTLAVEFMDSDWSLKQLHRAMVLSDLYQRGSSNAAADPATLAADPDNAFYWRMNPRRMESQAVRDSLLHLAGRLDLTLGGPVIDPAKSESSPRRSLYFAQTANDEHRFLAVFDNSNVLECYRRNESVMPQQALALTNSQLSRDSAAALAASLSALKPRPFIREAFLTVLGRQPTRDERQTAREGLAALSHDRALFLHALLNHNDFVTLR